MISTRNIKLPKGKKEKQKVLTTRDVKLPEKEEIDQEKILNTQSINSSMLQKRKRRRRKK